MAGAADNVGGVPLVGDSLRGPFDAISSAGQTLADTGTSLGMTVDQVARTAGIVIAVVPIVIVLALWAIQRIRFIRRATAAQRWLARPGALELFALRALTGRAPGPARGLGRTRPGASAAPIFRPFEPWPSSSCTPAVSHRDPAGNGPPTSSV